MTREEAIRLLTTKRAQPSTDYQMAEAYTMAINALEQEPKTAHWIMHPKGINAHLVCDNCFTKSPYDYCKSSYCPNCGRRMVELQESEAKNELDI